MNRIPITPGDLFYNPNSIDENKHWILCISVHPTHYIFLKTGKKRPVTKALGEYRCNLFQTLSKVEAYEEFASKASEGTSSGSVPF